MDAVSSDSLKKGESPLDKARAYLANQIKLQRDGRLPALKVLAKGAGVSSLAMAGALREAAHVGKIVAMKGRGLFILNGGQPFTSEESNRVPRRIKSSRLRETLQTALLEGRLEGVLDVAALAHQHGVSLPTLRKSLAGLEVDGYLRRERKQWLVVPPRSDQSFAALLFVAAGDGQGHVQIQNARQEEFLASLEKACGESRLNLVHVAISPEMELERAVLPHSPLWSGRGEPIAIVLWRTALMASTLQEWASYGKKRGLPVVLLDEFGDWKQASTTATSYRVFAIAGYMAGFRMGQHLLRLGHRKVGYFSVFHGSFWSRERVRGLKDAFKQAHLEKGVLEFCEDQDDKLHPTNPRVKMDAEDLEILARASDLLDRVRRQSTLVPFKSHDALLAMEDLVRFTRVNTYLLPLFQAARNTEGCTAWVGASDLITYFALRYCESENIMVPTHLTLVGFDNARWAMEYNLTTYSFNFHEMARMALAYVLAPKNPLSNMASMSAAIPAQRIECEGVLIERKTSGPPPAMI